MVTCSNKAKISIWLKFAYVVSSVSFYIFIFFLGGKEIVYFLRNRSVTVYLEWPFDFQNSHKFVCGYTYNKDDEELQVWCIISKIKQFTIRHKNPKIFMLTIFFLLVETLFWGCLNSWSKLPFAWKKSVRKPPLEDEF